MEGLDLPVRRYLEHSLAPGAVLAEAWGLTMRGKIRVGVKLPFSAFQSTDGRSFTWRARVPSDRFALLEVTDSYDQGRGGTVGRLAGRKLFADTGADAARSAATRAVMESTLAPATLLPSSGVRWAADSDREIRFHRPEIAEAGEVTIRIEEDGRPSEVEALRWRKEKNREGEMVPFRCRFSGERTFNGMTVPEGLVAGWVSGVFKPFFEARIASIAGISVP